VPFFSVLRRVVFSAVLALLLSAGNGVHAEREILPGISTDRVVLGKPYDLLGNRIVFTNWYYIDPGDLDWRDDSGKSVYVDGDEPVDQSHFIGIRPPHGINIAARKANVIGPFENMPYRSILQDGDFYKGWTSTEYFESRDGIQWEMKSLLKFNDPTDDGVHHVFIDPTAPPEQRYKAVWVGHINRAEFDAFRAKRPEGWEPKAAFLLGEQDSVACLRASVSPDGITWSNLPEPLVVEYCDTLNTAYYDVQLKKYVVFTRYWSVGPTAASQPVAIRDSWTGIGRRAIGRTESSDFSSFEPSEIILEPSPTMLPSESLYTNCYTTIPGAPDQHLMFPTIWNASIDDTTRVAMASSHNGKLWHWVPEGDVLETEAFGSWNGGCIWANPNLLELANGDWALPYLAHNVPHKYPRGQRVGGVGYAIWPKGRMVALEAKEEGEFTLIPVMPKGRTLKINATTKRTGWVKVEVVGDDERTLEKCKPIMGDAHWTAFTWNGESTESVREPEKPVTLRFQLYQAELYGIEFE
jgi:hypothetical protein